MKTYNIMQKARKYVIGAVIVGAIACTGCKPEAVIEMQIPVYSETQKKQVCKELDSLVVDYNKHLEAGKEGFLKGISDLYFSNEEQDHVYNNLDVAARTLDKIVAVSRVVGCQYSNLQMPKAEQQIYEGIYKNKQNYDFGKPELEKALNAKGINVKVERPWFNEISDYCLIGEMAAMSIFSIIAIKSIFFDGVKGDKKNEKQKNFGTKN